jgi:glucosamine--fructose-6-phosphate aminotransferase (isomerizing)
MSEHPSATYHEITTQPAAWEQALAAVNAQAAALRTLWDAGDFAEVIFTGCGSTYYLALAAAALFQDLTGCAARGAPAGELVLNPAGYYPTTGALLLVAVSRSGSTTETVHAVKRFREQQRGTVITISNYADRPLSTLGEVNIAIPAGQEESVAQTRSFASMYVAATALAALLADEPTLLAQMAQLPAAGERLLARYGKLAQALGSDLSLDRFYFLGSGARYGLACEVNLKMKEMTLTHSEPFHFLEFRHGPISMVGTSAAVIGLLSERNYADEEAVLVDVRGLGGRTLTLGERELDISFASQLAEPIRNVLYLPVLQLIAYHRAVAKGLNPDRPNNLNAVVTLNW